MELQSDTARNAEVKSTLQLWLTFNYFYARGFDVITRTFNSTLTTRQL